MVVSGESRRGEFSRGGGARAGGGEGDVTAGAGDMERTGGGRRGTGGSSGLRAGEWERTGGGRCGTGGSSSLGPGSGVAASRCRVCGEGTRTGPFVGGAGNASSASWRGAGGRSSADRLASALGRSSRSGGEGTVIGDGYASREGTETEMTGGGGGGSSTGEDGRGGDADRTRGIFLRASCGELPPS
jgi:hypothetical protein